MSPTELTHRSGLTQRGSFPRSTGVGQEVNMSTSDVRLSAFAALVLTIRAVRKVGAEQRFCQRGAKSWLAVFALFCPLFCAAQSEIEFKEYSAGLPFAISAGPDGAMWFTNY